jgi:hypothetical protein
MGLQFGGERPPVSGDMRKGTRKIPPHLFDRPAECVVVPEHRFVRCTPSGNEEIVVPTQVRCSDPENHHHTEPLTDPAMAWYDDPGWTTPQF